jgi:hypothetical protein
MEALKRASRTFKVSLWVTILIAAGTAWTLLGRGYLPSPDRLQLHYGHGHLVLMWYSDPLQIPRGRYWSLRSHWEQPGWKWSSLYPLFRSFPTVTTRGPSSVPRCPGWDFTFPLWPLLLPPAFIAFRAHRTIRRLSRDACKNCAYSRAGLAAEVSCPECGRAPTA